MDSVKADVAITVFGDELFAGIRQNEEKGDLEAVNRAKMSGRFVLTVLEFVGGLEFSGVVLTGVDGGRVPPKVSGLDFDPSQNFLNYAAHQLQLHELDFELKSLETRRAI